ncbi:MAG: hypothetical protein ACRC8Y_21635 [Chroococcales cyanobacterium]
MLSLSGVRSNDFSRSLIFVRSNDFSRSLIFVRSNDFSRSPSSFVVTTSVVPLPTPHYRCGN